MNILHSRTDPDLLTRLREMLDSSARADIAVGYFFMSGFRGRRRQPRAPAVRFAFLLDAQIATSWRKSHPDSNRPLPFTLALNPRE